MRATKVPKMRKAPVLTDEERAGTEILTRAWDRLQQHGRRRDALRTIAAQKKYIPGDILWDSMHLISKIRGRIRDGKYRASR